MLDNAGYEDAQIVVSNSLDEYTIRDLLHQEAKGNSAHTAWPGAYSKTQRPKTIARLASFCV